MDIKTKTNRGKILSPKAFKVLLIILASIIIFFIASFIGFKLKYSNIFYGHTYVNGIEISNMNIEEASKAISMALDNEIFVIKNNNKKIYEYSLKDDFGLTYELKESLTKIKSLEDDLGIITKLFTKKSYHLDNLKVNEEKFKEQISGSKFYHEGNSDITKDADIEFSEDEKRFVIKKEHQGTNINLDDFYKSAKALIASGVFEIDLSSGKYYEKPKVLSDNEALIKKNNSLNEFLGAAITYQVPDGEFTCDPLTYYKWLKYDEDHGVSIDSTEVEKYVQELAYSYNTYGNSKSFKTTKRGEIKVPGGNFGYIINKNEEAAELTKNITNKEKVTREPIYSQKEFSTNNGIGNTYVEIDLTNQQVYFYKDGTMVLSSGCVTGNPNKGNATPPGIYRIYNKQSPSILRGQIDPKTGKREYETPVTYWIPFNGGIGLHDANWQSAFGGERYLSNGSHGCVNLPESIAATIYSRVNIGTPVILYK